MPLILVFPAERINMLTALREFAWERITFCFSHPLSIKDVCWVFSSWVLVFGFCFVLFSLKRVQSFQFYCFLVSDCLTVKFEASSV